MREDSPKTAQPLVCPQCQHAIRKDDRFCQHCGTALFPQGPTRTQPRSLKVVLWVASALTAGLLILGVVIVHSLLTTRLATSPLPFPKPHPQIAVKNKPTTIPAAHLQTTSAPTPQAKAPSSVSTTWKSVFVNFNGATISLTLPSQVKPIAPQASGQWAWTTSPATTQIVLDITAAKSPQATQPLGPEAFGSPITRTTQSASQILDVAWAGHGYVALSMTVPLDDTAWLGTIAQSLRIT
ncbi:hypothetical protein BXT84_13945 [Sulfobacillus thermotolerans]|uniref:Zinc-ribbon domain-containing protein n=1 Tax=Sulfobacillus thermotolerans TaxID=338644 RepID=A0ABM6RTY8_9FIRM|nr:hypothetical protein BXT84_13945 [Sulfobacillus thermotolerans]